MGEDYFDIVFLNGETAILYGRRLDGKDFYRPLTDDERERVYSLTHKHDRQRDNLLRELATAESGDAQGQQP